MSAHSNFKTLLDLSAMKEKPFSNLSAVNCNAFFVLSAGIEVILCFDCHDCKTLSVFSSLIARFCLFCMGGLQDLEVYFCNLEG
jgi:hypothetical protein